MTQPPHPSGSAAHLLPQGEKDTNCETCPHHSAAIATGAIRRADSSAIVALARAIGLFR